MPLPRCVVPVVFASGTLLACTTSDPDTTAPTLRSAARGDAQTIRLTFSESMVVGEADPSVFRLSLGIKDSSSTVYYGLDYDVLGYDSYGPVSDGDPSAGSAGTTAPGDSSDSDDPTYTSYSTYGEGSSDPGEGGYEDEGYARPAMPDALRLPIPTRFVSDLGITAVRSVDGEPTQIELALANPLGDSPACAALAELTAGGDKAGIFVHHRAGGGSPTDRAGNPMPDLGAHWVAAIAQPYIELQGDFPNLDPYLPIACP
ncbi:MAG: hypothetical protein IAG13_23230 [Deltaproteobacteria bacterium]|nr:hypothetical protein [Nannocystaceae bacterium]